MKYSFFSRIRDILFLCALLCLIRTAFERTTSFIGEHKKSIIHELDRTFLDELYTTQRQLHFLEENYGYNDKYAHAIADIKKRLALIEEKYKINSPGVMLLGPIGSAAIVTKEEKLKSKLLDVVNDINKLIHIIQDPEQEIQHIATISTALENNKQLLQKITA